MKDYRDVSELKDEIHSLEAQLEAEKQERTVEIRARKQAEERWKNAEDANIKLCEQLEEARAEIERLKLRDRHMLDVYDSLGIKWGNDPFHVIAELKAQLENAKAEIESRKKIAESRYHPMALLEEQNARLKKALETIQRLSNLDMPLKAENARLKTALEEAKKLMETWHNVLGSTQLTHVQARMEVLESQNARLRELLKRCVGEVGGDMYSNLLMDIEEQLSNQGEAK